MKTAIVSTIINADNVIDSFIKYHQSIGISHFFFFIDDNSQSIINILETKYKDITTVIKNDTHLLLEYIRAHVPTFFRFKDKEVMARQILNTKIAMNKCLELGFDWLIHIDIDELVYLPNKDNINDIFSNIESQGYDSVVFHNHEAVPLELNIKDYFREVIIFKKNFNFLNSNQLNKLDLLKIKYKFFIGYYNGKSAVRVKSKAPINSVHRFDTENKTYIDSENVVLHYNCCGYDNFKDKYNRLGNFPDKWFEYIDIQLKFHLMARDIVKTKNDKLIKNFYIKEVIKFDEDAVKFFLINEIFEIITKPKDILDNLNKV